MTDLLMIATLEEIDGGDHSTRSAHQIPLG
jgi:hypothetical protein